MALRLLSLLFLDVFFCVHVRMCVCFTGRLNQGVLYDPELHPYPLFKVLRVSVDCQGCAQICDPSVAASLSENTRHVLPLLASSSFCSHYFL